MTGSTSASELVAAFTRYIGIDYSGAETPRDSLPGLRVYMAEGDGPAIEVLPPPSPRKYWTRRGVAESLVEKLGEPTPKHSCLALIFIRIRRVRASHVVGATLCGLRDKCCFLCR